MENIIYIWKLFFTSTQRCTVLVGDGLTWWDAQVIIYLWKILFTYVNFFYLKLKEFSKLLSMVTFYCKFSGALTFENGRREVHVCVCVCVRARAR